MNERDHIITHVEAWKSKDGWRWRLKARNGQILASSESYWSIWSMRRTAKRVASALKVPLEYV